MITLATLPQATEREVFEQVKNHLLIQNEKCEDDGGCRYRFKELKCAAGCLISDEEYKSSMEYQSWTTLFQKEIVPNNHSELIKKLQDLHDGNKPQYWEQKLNELEKTLSL